MLHKGEQIDNTKVKYTTFEHPNVWIHTDNIFYITVIPKIKDLVLGESLNWKILFTDTFSNRMITIENFTSISDKIRQLYIKNKGVKTLNYTPKVTTLSCYWNSLKSIKVTEEMKKLYSDNVKLLNISKKQLFNIKFLC